jgi:hypothetical protein
MANTPGRKILRFTLEHTLVGLRVVPVDGYKLSLGQFPEKRISFNMAKLYHLHLQ